MHEEEEIINKTSSVWTRISIGRHLWAILIALGCEKGWGRLTRSTGPNHSTIQMHWTSLLICAVLEGYPHVKGDNLSRWFRVFQSSHLIKGRGRLKRRLLMIIDFYVCLDNSSSLGCLAETCENFLFRDSLSFHWVAPGGHCTSLPLSGIWPSSISLRQHKSCWGLLVSVSCSKWRLDLLRSRLY